MIESGSVNKLPLSKLLEKPEMDIPPEVIEALRQLDVLGFRFKSMASNGSYFECINSNTYNGQVYYARSVANGN